QEKLEEIYMNQYGKEHFIRIVDQPRCTVVKGTNFCDIGLKSSGNKIVVMSATDNMMKGAAGTAIQNMNLMLGFDEKQGLMFSGFHP
ncbi:N-acetyl-gamma-glutamyl-phosphate reductase, partial [Candidatus Micrarchaeota archaeon]|nr:N-acetyl-gamma-glutamyl-phosphate reductase [Candidatus Micrarchaeota archaeon]